jgi:cytochrome c5
MYKHRSPFLTGVLIAIMAFATWISGMTLLARAQTDSRTSAPAPTVRNTGQKTGEEVFMDNCSRCHKPPMTISPRTTGTVVMHMRVRAKLSRQDEQALLRYLAP